MDVGGSVSLGRTSVCPNGHTLMLILVFYTIAVCLICYIIMAPVSTLSVPRREVPVEDHLTNSFRNQYIFSQSHPASPVSGTNSSTIDKNHSKTESVEVRPSVLWSYRSMKDYQPLDKTCSTCAIVSSSGQLLGKGAGEEIDNSSCVLRMNAAPVKGFEKDVGARTTLRVVCFISAKGLKNEASSMLLGPLRPEMILFWGLHQSKHKNELKVANEVSSEYMDHVDFYSQTLEGEDAASSLFKEEIGYSRGETNSWLSTGWFTIMVALDMCQEIHIYGMVPDEYCKFHQKEATKYHYFQKKRTPTECGYYTANEASSKGGHRFITEKAVFARWGKKYQFKFHHPVWNLESVNITKPLNTPFSRRQSVLEAENARRKHTTNVLFKVLAIVGAVLCLAGVIGIYTL